MSSNEPGNSENKQELTKSLVDVGSSDKSITTSSLSSGKLSFHPYWRNFLTYIGKEKDFVVSLSNLVVAILGFSLTILSLKYVANTLRSTAYQTIMNQQMELDKKLVEEYKIRKYFERGVPIEEIALDSDDYQKIMAMADLKLDFLDSISEQFYYFPGFFNENNKISILTWKAYFYDSFQNSPALCKRLKETRLWYDSDFIEQAKPTCMSLHNIEIKDIDERDFYKIF